LNESSKPLAMGIVFKKSNDQQLVIGCFNYATKAYCPASLIYIGQLLQIFLPVKQIKAMKL